VNQLLYRLNYFDAPVVKEKGPDHLILESIRNKVWNPVFTVGVIAFVLSMTLRGFFNQNYAASTLAISTFVLFAGVWKLSSTAMVVFDKKESKVYFVYKHLGYLQKVYTHALTSFDEVELVDSGNRKFRVQLLKDDGTQVKIAERKDRTQLQNTAGEISSFLNLQLKEV